MILFNTTFMFPESAREDFLGHLRGEWLPAAEAAGSHSPLCAEIECDDAPGMNSVALQGRFESEADAVRFADEVLPDLFDGITARFGVGNVLWFSTPMKIVEL